MSIIDIHTHVLPGVDDGAGNEEIAIQMLTLAYEQGVRAIIATPHFDGTQSYTSEELKEQVSKLQKEALKIGNDFKLYPGNEIFYEPGAGCLESLKNGEICTLANGRYILVEFSTSEEYKIIYNGMKELVLEGYCPVIAHMERYQCLYKNRERVKSLVDVGCYLQVNAESFLGGFFSTESNYVRKLATDGLIHFIASDSHNLRARRCRLKECRAHLSKKLSEDILDRLFYKNPQMIIENKYI